MLDLKLGRKKGVGEVEFSFKDPLLLIVSKRRSAVFCKQSDL